MKRRRSKGPGVLERAKQLAGALGKKGWAALLRLAALRGAIMPVLDALKKAPRRAGTALVAAAGQLPRLLGIGALALVILVAAQGIWRLVNPPPVAEGTLVLEPFDVLEGGKIEREKEEAVPGLIARRVRRIDAVLWENPGPLPTETGVHISPVPVKEAALNPVTKHRVDVDFRPYNVDVVGIYGFMSSHLSRRDTVTGLVSFGADRTELFAQLRSASKNGVGPWHEMGDGRVGEAVDLLSHAIVRDNHLTDLPQLQALDGAQMRTFVEGLEAFHSYVHLADGAERQAAAEASLARAEEFFAALERQNHRCSLVYRYLARVRRLRHRPADQIVPLLEAAVTLDKDDPYAVPLLQQYKEFQPREVASEAEKGLAALKSQWSFEKINAGKAASEGGKGAPVPVGILCTRVDAQLDALKDRLLPGASFAEGGGAGGAGDDGGFGTDFATLLAALAPAAQVLPIQVFDASGSASTGDIAKGIDFAITKKVRILLMPYTSALRTDVEAEVVKRAQAAGLFLVAPAGNDASTDAVYPAALPGVLAVGATGKDDRKTSFSNFGNWVRLYAPGEDVHVLSNKGKAARVETVKGTNYSAAIVAGVAALVLASNPELKPQDVQSILIESARLIPGTEPAIQRVDALAAVRAAKEKRGN